MAYSSEVLADSISSSGHRLTTLVVTFPRMVLAEFNTHRVLSRNSASSRAIPVEKQLLRIESDPFIPIHWGANQPGMQANAELEPKAQELAEQEWLSARDDAVARVKKLLEIGLHKQITNRILEPFMWHTVIVTATEWDNFYALRANPQAQPEIRRAAELMLEAFEGSDPQVIATGQWHLPLIQDDEREWAHNNIEDAIKVSVGRCARVSYLTHDGTRDFDKDIGLYERLAQSGHMSPLEHVATPFSEREIVIRNNLTHFVNSEIIDDQTRQQIAESLMFSGNFKGWTQYRKTIPNEGNFAKVEEGTN